jgi:hypothetical protein
MDRKAWAKTTKKGLGDLGMIKKNGINVLTNTERMKVAIQLAKHLFNSFLDCTQPIVIVYAIRSNSALCNNFVCRT